MQMVKYFLALTVLVYLTLQTQALHAMTPIISSISRPTLLSFKIFWWLPRIKPDHYILRYKPLSNSTGEFKEVGGISNDKYYYTLKRLQHDTEYEFRLVSVDKNGRQFVSDPAFAFTGITGTDDGIYILNGRKEYFFSKYRLFTWHDAKFFCKNIDMELLSVETTEENNFIKSYLEKQDNGRSYWTSGSDRGGNNNEFYWDSTGKDLTFTDFHTNEPNNGGGKGEYYIGYIYDNGHYKWNDLNGTQHLNIICEQSLFHFEV